MKAPSFWRSPNAVATALSPLGAAYGRIGRWRRQTAKPWRAEVPVLCIGNLTAGGAGKTPVALSLALRLRAMGLEPHFLSRGYGGRMKGPVMVDPGRHEATDVGDEPLLLAEAAPTWVARDRAAGAKAAIDAGATVLVMDDGFQNPALAKDVSLVVVDGETGFGNGRLIPAGPLREPLADGLGRASALAVMGDDRAGVGALAEEWELPVLFGRLVPDGDAGWLRGTPVVAFAGIGRPEKFFATLKALGARPTAEFAFGDHHRYEADEIMRMVDLANRAKAVLVTTTKDRARLPPDARPMVRTLPVRVSWSDDGAVDRLLEPLLP
ncbi:tetraacyldisaccharide 4'-kinase [Inquilinus sp. CAU 1745]|uniref:tetraacyldisaccharide 4'-kinase n=1 Tax=Inquilinus sp. CAU 1745 TaxID=3140369 RepID=UPI00325B5B3F